MIRYETNLNSINWNDAVTVFELAPLGTDRRDPAKLQKTFEASDAVLSVFHSDRLIGMGRAVCNGSHQGTIYDVVLLPEYQGMGIGKQIIKNLCDQLPVHSIILYPISGLEGFYQKCGFKKARTAMALFTPIMSKAKSDCPVTPDSVIPK